MQVTFHDLDLLKFHAIRARLRAQVDEMTSSQTIGEHTWFGCTSKKVTLEWMYDHEEKLLTVRCIDRPWWISEAMVASRIRGAVEAAGR
jgi:hypothetical protein